MRGAWIEIILCPNIAAYSKWSLPMRGAWIEIYHTIPTYPCGVSLPMRGAWIEI